MPTSKSRSAAAPLDGARPLRPARAQRGIQSVEVGGRLLLALAHQGTPLALKDLAREAGMAPAKAHPYLVSFAKLGLIAQDDTSGRYGLGPLALQLGLISLQQFDPVRLAVPLLRELAASLGLTVAIAVWGNRGATIVSIEEPPSPVHVSLRHGTVMSVRGTASGLLFAAHLPPDALRAALADEAGSSGRERIDDTLAGTLARIRRQGLSRASDAAVPGVSAMAAPVFDAGGAIAIALMAIGPSLLFDARLDGSVATQLRQAARTVSAQLGAARA